MLPGLFPRKVKLPGLMIVLPQLHKLNLVEGHGLEAKGTQFLDPDARVSCLWAACHARTLCTLKTCFLPRVTRGPLPWFGVPFPGLGLSVSS